jgi:hypothetical protein
MTANGLIREDDYEAQEENTFWYYLSSSSIVTMDKIEQNLNWTWNWKGVSMNPNLTMAFIEKHIDKRWDWGQIHSNHFIKEKEYFMIQRCKEHLAAFRIQQHWFKAKLNPNYALCKKRVNEFYDNVIAPVFCK